MLFASEMSLQRALCLGIGAVSVSRGVRREARPRYRCYLLALYEIAKATSVVPKQDSAKGECKIYMLSVHQLLSFTLSCLLGEVSTSLQDITRLGMCDLRRGFEILVKRLKYSSL